MKRREFLAASAAVAALSMTNPSFVQADSIDSTYDGKSANLSAKAKLRISSQFGQIPGNSISDKAAYCKKWGIEALEFGGIDPENAKKARKELDDNGMFASAICWGSHNGDLCSEVVEKRQPGIDDLKKALEAAGILGASGVIYVPAFNGQTKLTNQEIRKILLDTFPALAEFAAECGTAIIFEPLNRGEAYFLRQVADGAAISRDIAEKCSDKGKSGIKVMGDFYHMSIEETNMMGAFISGGEYLAHVHLAGGVTDPRRTIPGQNKTRFVEGFRGLKYIGYDKFCSFECGVRGDREVEVPKACEFLRKEWELAII